MPSWKIHLLFNLLFVIIWIKFLFNFALIDNYTLLSFLILFNVFASLFPDIDTSKSKIRDYTSLSLATLITIYFLLNFHFSSVRSLLISFIFLYLLIKYFPLKHRGITHTLWFSIIFSILLTGILWLMFEFSLVNSVVYFLIILFGYLSHLFLDKMT